MIWGLIIIYIICFIELLIYANLHGKKSIKINFWIKILDTIIALTLIWWALGWRFW